jgi:hypothetical protein
MENLMQECLFHLPLVALGAEIEYLIVEDRHPKSLLFVQHQLGAFARVDFPVLSTDHETSRYLHIVRKLVRLWNQEYRHLS